MFIVIILTVEWWLEWWKSSFTWRIANVAYQNYICPFEASNYGVGSTNKGCGLGWNIISWTVLGGTRVFTQNICNNVCNRRNIQTNKIAFLTCVLNNDRLWECFKISVSVFPGEIYSEMDSNVALGQDKITPVQWSQSSDQWTFYSYFTWEELVNTSNMAR